VILVSQVGAVPYAARRGRDAGSLSRSVGSTCMPGSGARGRARTVAPATRAVGRASGCRARATPSRGRASGRR
jgi:hypothetical protein